MGNIYKNPQKDYLFNYLASGFEKSRQATLNQMYYQSCRIDEENHRREMEQMKKEITDEVLSSISTQIDVAAIVEEIEYLHRMIDNLGR